MNFFVLIKKIVLAFDVVKIEKWFLESPAAELLPNSGEDSLSSDDSTKYVSYPVKIEKIC